MTKICKVLIVEDNDDVQQLLETVFVGEGYDFVLARNGDEAREAVATHGDIDILVIDVGLPGPNDGLALATEMAGLGHTVLLVTGDHRHVERIEQAGHRYLLKPFRIDSLLALVELILRETHDACRRRSQQENHNCA